MFKQIYTPSTLVQTSERAVLGSAVAVESVRGDMNPLTVGGCMEPGHANGHARQDAPPGSETGSEPGSEKNKKICIVN